MSGTPFPALPNWVPFYPYPRVLYGWTEYTDVITKFSGIDRFKKRNLLQQPWATIQHVARFTEEGRYGQPKYCYEKAIYVVMISFALVSLSSSLTMGYRQHEFRLNKGYNVVSGHSAHIFLVVRPGNILCFDSEVDLQKWLETTKDFQSK